MAAALAETSLSLAAELRGEGEAQPEPQPAPTKPAGMRDDVLFKQLEIEVAEQIKQMRSQARAECA